MIDVKQVQSKLGNRKMATQTETVKAPKAANAAVAENAANAAKGTRGRQKAADAAYKLLFVNDKGEEGARIPSPVTAVKIVAADNKADIINLKDIPAAVLAQYAADGLRKKANFFLKDATKSNPAQVHSLVAELLKASKEATIFIPKEGGGPGRTFDFDFWVAVMAKAAQIKVDAGNPKAKLMTDKLKTDFRKKLESMTPDERKQKKEKWMQDKAVKNAVKLVQAERAQAEMAGETFEEEYDALQDF